MQDNMQDVVLSQVSFVSILLRIFTKCYILLKEIESIEMCIDDVLICETTAEKHHKRPKSAFGRTMK